MSYTADRTARPSARRRYGDAVESLKARAQKSRRGAPPYSLLVNRPAGRRIAAAASVLGLTPNSISLISGTVSAVGLVAFAAWSPSPLHVVVAVAALLVGYAIDSADGQLARLTTGGTLAGEWLDHSLDMVKMSSFHVVIGISLVRFPGSIGLDRRWAVAGVVMGFGVVAVTSFFVFVLTDLLRRQVGGAGPPRPTAWWFMLLGAPTDYGVQCLWLLTRPWPRLFFGGYTLLAVANLGYLCVGMRSRFGQLRALDRERAA
ncbi:MAG: CDP-alcohol phosphatidyltransferase family protein [Microthrixaceae bacterium]